MRTFLKNYQCINAGTNLSIMYPLCVCKINRLRVFFLVFFFFILEFFFFSCLFFFLFLVFISCWSRMSVSWVTLLLLSLWINTQNCRAYKKKGSVTTGGRVKMLYFILNICVLYCTLINRGSKVPSRTLLWLFRPVIYTQGALNFFTYNKFYNLSVAIFLFH